MKFLRLIAVIIPVSLLLVALTPDARAGIFDKKTFVTFSQPVEIPGSVLPSGTYVIERVENAQHVVRILSADETHVYATLLTIPEYLTQPAEKPLITLEERSVGSPQAVQAWFYPGDTTGEEFLYPKSAGIVDQSK